MVRCSDVASRSNILRIYRFGHISHPLSLGKIVLTMLSHRLGLNILLFLVIVFGLEFTFTKCHFITANFYYCPNPLRVSIVEAHQSSRSLSSFYWGEASRPTTWTARYWLLVLARILVCQLSQREIRRLLSLRIDIQTTLPAC